jgi:hypothetical protein
LRVRPLCPPGCEDRSAVIDDQPNVYEFFFFFSSSSSSFPDLKITGVTITGWNSAPVVVKNYGFSKSGGCWLRLSAPALNGPIYTYAYVSSLIPGQQKVINISTSVGISAPGAASTYKVDAFNTILELSESNNTYSHIQPPA